MHRLIRLRHLTILAALVLVGLLPAYACRPLGTADNFAVLTPTLTQNAAGTATIQPGTGSGTGAAAAGGNTQTLNGGGTFAATGGVAVGTAAVTTALADFQTNGQAIFNEAQGSGTALSGTLGGVTLTPGTYFITGTGTVGAGTTLTLNGAGDYVIAMTGGLTVADGAVIATTNGANPANVTFVVGTTTTIGAATVAGRILSSGGINVAQNATINGRLYDLNQITFNGNATVNDPGASPNVTLTPTATDISVAVGQTATFQVSATDPDATGTVTVDQFSTNLPAGFTFTPTLPQSGTTAGSTFSFTPTAGQEGTYQITLRATDQSGAVCDQTVNITVTAAGTPPSFVGATPEEGSTLVACVGRPLTFTVATAGSPGTDVVTLSATGAPTGGSFTPTLPLSTANATTSFTFTPTAKQAGQIFPVTFTAAGSNNASVTRTVNISAETPVPTQITVTQVSPGPKKTILPGTQVCNTATVFDQCGGTMAGQNVTFTLTGNTGGTLAVLNGTARSKGKVAHGQSTQTVTVTTGKNGVTPLVCFTPVNPNSSASLGASVGKVTSGTNNPTTISVGEAAGGGSTAGADVFGTGIVDAGGLGTNPLGGNLQGIFGMHVKDTNRGPQGTLSFDATADPSSPGGVFRARATSIDSIAVTDTPEGRSATVLGTMRTNRFGTVPFEVDVIDSSTPGVPGDSFVMTLFLEDQTTVFVGGNLEYRRDRHMRLQDDIVVRVGLPSVGR